MGHLQQCSRSPLSTLGGGGDRTRVLQYITRASPGAACSGFLSPGGLAGEPPPGSVAVGCPAYPRDRDERWILLTDARHRAGGAPGLTTSNSRQAARARCVRLTLALIELRSQVLRGYVRRPRPASPGSTTEVETNHPHVQLSGEPWDRCIPAFTTCSRYPLNARRPTRIPRNAVSGRGPRAGNCAPAARRTPGPPR